MTMLPYRLILFTTIQLAALIFLGWVVVNLAPVMVKTLFWGMNQWKPVSVAFCWTILVGLAAVLLSVRNFLQQHVFEWMTTQPRLPLKMSWVLIALVSFRVYWLLVVLVFSSSNGFGFFMLVQCLLLFMLVYCLTGIAAPMGSFRVFRLLFLNQPDQKRTILPLSSGDNHPFPASKSITSAPISPQARPKPKQLGYPRWIWPILWFLFWMLLKWMGM